MRLWNLNGADRSEELGHNLRRRAFHHEFEHGIPARKACDCKVVALKGRVILRILTGHEECPASIDVFDTSPDAYCVGTERDAVDWM